MTRPESRWYAVAVCVLSVAIAAALTTGGLLYG